MKVLAALLAVAVLAVGCGRANSENAAFVGPLDVIPDLDVEDPLVTCPGTPAVRYSRMIDPPSIDEVDHPAVDALRALLDAPLVEPLPRGLWVVISIDDDGPRSRLWPMTASGSPLSSAAATSGSARDKLPPVARANRPSRFQPGSAGSRSASTPIRCPAPPTRPSTSWSPSEDAPTAARWETRSRAPR